VDGVLRCCHTTTGEPTACQPGPWQLVSRYCTEKVKDIIRSRHSFLSRPLTRSRPQSLSAPTCCAVSRVWDDDDVAAGHDVPKRLSVLRRQALLYVLYVVSGARAPVSTPQHYLIRRVSICSSACCHSGRRTCTADRRRSTVRLPAVGALRIPPFTLCRGGSGILALRGAPSNASSRYRPLCRGRRQACGIVEPRR
jgi:hypothetical protein